jgi:hypothetical protein
MNKFTRMLIGAALPCAVAFFSGCTRHKKGADAFEHYFETKPPEGVTLIQAHWAGFYYPFGLDAEQMLLEFVAPEKVINKFFPPEPPDVKPAATTEEKEKVFGWQTDEAGAIRHAMEVAPKWFTPASAANYQLGFVLGQSAVVRLAQPAGRYRLIIYDSGNGHIFIDDTANRVYIAQDRGKLF